MPKYYIKEHEIGYRKIKAEGKTHWSELHGQSGFDDFALRPLLEHMLLLLSFSVPHPRTLVYGCGTGPGACFLAARGFQVDGIDISPIAIDMAKQFAADRRLSINYAVSDMCTLPTPGTRTDTRMGTPYDLIVDDFCLQCIVTDSDRANVFSAVRSRLKGNGYYLIGTAIFAEGRDYSDQVFDEATGTVYTRLETDASIFADAVELSDGWYLPNRRHLKPEDLIKELEEAKFQTLWHREEDSSMGLLCQHTS